MRSGCILLLYMAIRRDTGLASALEANPDRRRETGKPVFPWCGNGSPKLDGALTPTVVIRVKDSHGVPGSLLCSVTA